MFEHPGEKVKSFALIFFWITVIGGGIAAIVTAIAAGSFWLFLGIALGSLICAYLSGLFLSGFGELIESSQENAATNKQILRKLESSGPDQHPSAPSPVPAQQRAARSTPTPTAASGAPAGKWRCDCGRINENYVSSCTCGRSKREVMLARSKSEVLQARANQE